MLGSLANPPRGEHGSVRRLITNHQNMTMNITIQDLIANYKWEEIERVLSALYPTSRKSSAEYKEAYQKFAATVPTKTNMRILVQENSDTDFGKWVEVYGRNGTLVKDELPGEHAHQQFEDAWESEQGYALSYTDWTEIAGMTIDPSTLTSIGEKDIVAHILVEITKQWHSDRQLLRVSEEVQDVKRGLVRNVVSKEQVGSTGFLHKWSEKANGEFHGLDTTYWPGGVIIAQQGIIIDGNKEDVWTYWDRNGKLKNQVRFSCDREIEKKSDVPWWNDAKDQS